MHYVNSNNINKPLFIGGFSIVNPKVLFTIWLKIPINSVFVTFYCVFPMTAYYNLRV